MIDVNKALELIEKNGTFLTAVQEMALPQALGFVLAEDIISTLDMPPFRQSAMDGYALRIGKNNSYSVIGEIKAGDNKNLSLKMGEAVRIFTGAPVPDSADTVIMQEKIIQDQGYISVEGSIEADLNIRPKGEQIHRGEIALKKGTTLKGAHIGYLASLGFTTVKVHLKPSVALVITGNELVPLGQLLPQGKIYESNGAMLTAVLTELGYKNVSSVSVKDELENTKGALLNAMETHDIVLVTGGISVGDYDYVGKALKAIKVEKVFYKVKQKPGKPLYFGKKESTSIFALPGNPAAALSCFYIYVFPLLKQIEGASVTQLERITMPIIKDYIPKGNQPQFLKARVLADGVEILSGQSSAMLRSFGVANALVFLPENTGQITQGEPVKVILTP
ncbi:molybdopterin molybdotransferase MoeA [Flagellimonas alvinocaridis]|uniref:Molybdopterin molybdenumtransferase n=1 Tax=Flagellimonas alvinocaridis TaxID=2530200 RepID=A0A4S8RSY5_9FLAO|nr:gephyrin-like molybdotransferase Glp [Allomuricauda alvinocaridis]THV57014.1 molybdopterin molybdotransferase MoeA [Allomuricauda alvinocaridis]